MLSWQTSAAEYWSTCQDVNNLVEWVVKKETQTLGEEKTDNIWTNALLWNNEKHLLWPSMSLPESKYDETVCNWSMVDDQYKNSSTAACFLRGLRDKYQNKGSLLTLHVHKDTDWKSSTQSISYAIALSPFETILSIHFQYILSRAAGSRRFPSTHSL